MIDGRTHRIILIEWLDRVGHVAYRTEQVNHKQGELDLSQFDGAGIIRFTFENGARETRIF